MTEETKTIIDIQGVKMEVDLRHATRVDEIRVGDRVRVLCKPTYGETAVRAGIVIGFEPFETLPTIIVCYVDAEYSNCNLKFVYFNAKTTEYELILSVDDDKLALDRSEMLTAFDRQIEAKRKEMDELLDKKAFFEQKFERYWEPVVAEDPDAEEVTTQ